jgi:hypothetical protein
MYKSESIIVDQYETRLKQQDADLQTAGELDIQDDNERQQLLDHGYGEQGGPTPQDDDAWQYYHDSIYRFLVGYYCPITVSMYDDRRHALEAEKAEALYTWGMSPEERRQRTERAKTLHEWGTK